MIDAMTAYIDAQGRRWDSAEEALADFLADMPPLDEEQIENVFSATNWQWDAARNLKAIEYAITYHGLHDVFGYYPVPQPEDTANTVKIVSTPMPVFNDMTATNRLLAILQDDAAFDPGWRWDGHYMLANETDWDIAHVPFFQAQRQYFNRRMLARTSTNPNTPRQEPVTLL